jgi:5S rRNA maturation endonuclease (ribonuclease M5)
MDWVGFLDDNAVTYVTRGPNTRSGEVSVQCPWCGEDDPSQHLGISLESENWGCLRSVEHRGKSAAKLIQALLGCSYTQAKLIASQYSLADPDALPDATTLFDTPTKPFQAPVRLIMPAEFEPVRRTGNGKRFWQYLHSRGFENPSHLADCYDLRACHVGEWKDRLIIPFYEDGELIGWQGRALGKPRSAPRYLSSSEALKQTVFNYDRMKEGGEILFICEGPFDAIKLDYYGNKFGVCAVCTTGTTFSTGQVSILNSEGRLYRRVVCLFDPDAVGPSFHIADWLAHLAPIIGILPDGVKDPGDLTRAQVEELCQSLLRQ